MCCEQDLKFRFIVRVAFNGEILWQRVENSEVFITFQVLFLFS